MTLLHDCIHLPEWARGAGVPEVSGVCVQSDKFSGMMHRLSVDGFHDNYQHNTISDSKIKHCGGTDGIATILKSSGTPALRAHSSRAVHMPKLENIEIAVTSA